MKLTWFGDDTFRIHAAGAIVVVEGEGALPGVDRAELVSGADLVVAFAGAVGGTKGGLEAAGAIADAGGG
ncbi:hypothetical protein [Devosia sp.]|uniref:hypothetical protein n=1 Tax=Devosia sp. TaxID=1871048 RepID=UPI0025F0551B|nr:hypothetical protein [Devosia sp.]MCR6634819.1 hypothetical protein [Devosia sp.]